MHFDDCDTKPSRPRDAHDITVPPCVFEAAPRVEVHENELSAKNEIEFYSEEVVVEALKSSLQEVGLKAGSAIPINDSYLKIVFTADAEHLKL